MSVAYPFPADKYVLVGRVNRAHGVRGEMRVTSLSVSPEKFKTYSRVALVAADGRMTALLSLTRVRQQNHQLILKLDTIDTKSEADLTAGMGVLLPIEDVAGRECGEQSLHRFNGLTVRLVDSETIIGTVEGSFHNGAQEILVVRDKGYEYLIPYVPEFIIKYSDHELILDPPPGLLEITSGKDHQDAD